MSGVLVAVVGPSGAGKDAVIDGARRQLRDDPGVIFPPRFITRPSSAAEANEHVSRPQFLERQRRGGFAVAWQAHGQLYGIGHSVRFDVADGAVVVVNLSRGALADVSELIDSVAIVEITAPDDLRRARLARRAREDSDAVLQRMHRPNPAPDVPPHLTIVNDGALDDAVHRFAEYIAQLST